MTVQIIDNKALWDDFVEKSPYSLLFHRWDFLKIMEKYSGMQLLPYGIYNGNELICLFPLFFRRMNGLKILYSPPMQVLLYVPHLGFIMSQKFSTLKQKKKEGFLEIVATEMGKEIAKLGPNYISISTSPKLDDMRPFAWGGYTLKPQYGYVIDLEDSLDNLWNGLEKNLRSYIKAVERQSDSLRLEEVKDAEKVFEIMRDKLSAYGQTFYHCQSPDYLKDLIAAFPANVKIYFLYDREELKFAIVTTEYKDRMLLWMGGTHLDDSHYPDYVHWALIRKAKADGLKICENWGADTKRLCPYKAKFNPSLELCFELNKRDAFGTFAGWAFFKALEIPGVKTVLLKSF